MADDSSLAEATAPLSFAEFLERMKDPAAADLVRSIKNFIKTFNDRRPEPDKDSELVQQFLTRSEAAFRPHPVWAGDTPDHQAQAIEGLEKYLMTKIYGKTFAASPLDRERDEALAARCAALSFVRPQHLDIPPPFHDENAWALAMKELHKINSYKAPRDKLVCILNCCRIINNLLHVTVQQGEARGADDFLPILIYVVIHANPPQLASNLEYIQRFRMQSRMVSESSYFFTQLYSAASFIETISSGSLSMEPDEFVARMVAAGLPDMQVLPTAAAAATDGPPAGDKAAAAPKALNVVASAQSAPSATPAAALSQGARLPSVAELQRRGAPLVLAAEAGGQLQARHPLLYAQAADMRLADIDALLAAYKQLVLKHEALSLAVAQVSGAEAAAAEVPALGSPLTASGPNPFAGVGWPPQPAAGAAAAAGSGLSPSSPDLLAFDAGQTVAPQLDPFSQPAVPRAAQAAAGGAGEAQQQPAGTLTPVAEDAALAELAEPVPELASPAAASPAASQATGGRTSEDGTQRVLSMAAEDSQSPRELQLQQPEAGAAAAAAAAGAAAAAAGTPEPEAAVGRLLGARTQPEPQLARLVSEVPMPRSYVSSPFMPLGEVELPRPALPDPFASELAGVPAEPSALPRLPTQPPLDQPVQEAVSTAPPRSVASPFGAPEAPEQPAAGAGEAAGEAGEGSAEQQQQQQQPAPPPESAAPAAAAGGEQPPAAALAPVQESLI